MKSVLISIQPKWCELIASGKKTVEVRKTKPKIDVPFKVYIYATQPQKQFDYGLCLDEGRVGLVCKINYETAKHYNIEILSGKVIGEFVCDKIEQGHILWVKEQPEYYDKIEEKTQLTYRQMFDYLGESGVGCFWHISDLVIYEKPRGLREFYKPCENLINGSCKISYPFNPCGKIGLTYERFGKNGEHHRLVEKNACLNVLHRPPQSWCYVESEDTE